MPTNNLLHVQMRNGTFGAFCMELQKREIPFGTGAGTVVMTDRDFRKAASLPILKERWFRVMDKEVFREYRKRNRRRRLKARGLGALSKQ